MSITLKNITKSYKKVTAVEDISFEVKPGELFGLIGPDGAGKTTLFQILTTLLFADKGEATVAGYDVVKDYKKIRNSVGYMPGKFSLYQDLTVEENLRAGHIGEKGRIPVKLENVYTLFPHLKSLTKKEAGWLSGGEQQRVLIARALAQSTPVMLLDEPTAHLDLRHQDILLKLVRDLAFVDNLAVMITLHDLNLVARFADRVALLSDGRVRKIGTPAEILTPDELAEVYGIRIHVIPHPLDGKPLVLSG